MLPFIEKWTLILNRCVENSGVLLVINLFLYDLLLYIVRAFMGISRGYILRESLETIGIPRPALPIVQTVIFTAIRLRFRLRG
jgi:hypothetical protein